MSPQDQTLAAKMQQAEACLHDECERGCRFNCDAESSCKCDVHLMYRLALTCLTAISSVSPTQPEQLSVKEWADKFGVLSDRLHAIWKANQDLDAIRQDLHMLYAEIAPLFREATSVSPTQESNRIFDNHHNAMLCPYCNPLGLVLIDPKRLREIDEATSLSPAPCSTRVIEVTRVSVTPEQQRAVQEGLERGRRMAEETKP